MPVVFDNKGFSFTTGTTVSLSFNFTAAANATLIAYTGGEANRSCSSVTYNGVSLSLLADVATGAMQVWGLQNPAAGVNTVVVNWVTGAANAMGCVVASYTQCSGWGTVASTATGATVCNLIISATTTALVSYGLRNDGAAATLSPGTTRHSSSVSGSCKLIIADTAGTGPTTTVSGANAGVSSFTMAGLPLFFSAVAVNSIRMRSLMGVGF